MPSLSTRLYANTAFLEVAFIFGWIRYFEELLDAFKWLFRSLASMDFLMSVQIIKKPFLQ